MPIRRYYFLFIISICVFSFIKVNSYQLPLKGKVIYVDAGHGGIDSGAIYKDILEKDINLELSYLLMSSLENKGAKVYMTRYGDYDLSNTGVSLRKRSDLFNRADIINESKADMYISLHLNSITSSKWSGAQVFYDDINDDNQIIAQAIQEQFTSKRKIKEINTKYMYRRIKIPGVLVEAGFLSNYSDRQKLLNKNTQEELVNQIVNGVISFYQNKSA